MNTEEITKEFFKRRFPENSIEFEKKTGYFQEWMKRFESENPEGFMDDISQKVWEEMSSVYINFQDKELEEKEDLKDLEEKHVM